MTVRVNLRNGNNRISLRIRLRLGFDRNDRINLRLRLLNNIVNNFR